jgi:aldose 1-epimerase
MSEGEATIGLRSAGLAAELAPALGGRMSALRLADGRDIIVPMVGWPDAPWRWPKTGAYPLIPYSNRIRSARLATVSGIVPLKPHPDADQHTLHGPAHLRPWTCIGRNDSSATLALDYAPDADWPWAFWAEQSFTLDGDALALRLAIANTGAEAFPVGLGWHPYFVWLPGATLSHDARLRWPMDADAVATGASEPNAPPHARTEYLSEWARAEIAFSDGLRLELTADPVFGHLVCHRPDGDAYACVEPVTHTADGFNLAVRGVELTGARTLAPGETLSGDIRLRITHAGTGL